MESEQSDEALRNGGSHLVWAADLIEATRNLARRCAAAAFCGCGSTLPTKTAAMFWAPCNFSIAIGRNLSFTAVVTYTTCRAYLQGPGGVFLSLMLGIASVHCQVQTLVNVDFGGKQGAKVGYAAVGTSPSDYWNVVPGPAERIQNVTLANGDLSDVSVALSNALLRQVSSASDAMYGTFVGSNSTNYPSVTFKNMSPGVYDLYVYGHGRATNDNGVYTVTVSGIDYGKAATWKGPEWNSRTWQENLQYVVFRAIQITNATQTLQLQVLPGESGNAVLSGIQLIGYTTLSPDIIINPEDQSVDSGSTASFRVAAAGAEPLYYQWFYADEPIPGATNASLVLSTVSRVTNGLYWLTVSNAYGEVTSQKAILSVHQLRQSSLLNIDTGGIAGIKLGPAAIGVSDDDFWDNFSNSYPGDGNVITHLHSADGSVTGVALIVTPEGPGQWSNGASDPMYAAFMYAPDLTITLTNLPVGLYDLYAYGHYWGELDPGGATPIAAYNVLVNGLNYGTNTEVTNTGWDSPYWQEGVQYVLFRNILVTNSSALLSLLALPQSPTAPLGNSSFLAGVQLIRYSNLAPVIVSPPKNYSVVHGSTIGFSQASVGLAPLSFQWFFNEKPISNATTSSLVISNVQQYNSGYYSFVASNEFGEASAIAGRVLVDEEPSRSCLLNVNFGSLPGAKRGEAASGIDSEDYWNSYYFPGQPASVISDLVLSDGTVSSTVLAVSGAPSAGRSSASDPMYNTFLDSGGFFVTITNLLPGSYDLNIYGHGPATAFPDFSLANGTYTVFTGSINYGTNSNIVGIGWDDPNWQEGVQFVTFRSLQITNVVQPLTISALPGQAGYAVISGLQLLRVNPRSPTHISLTLSKDSLGNSTLELLPGIRTSG